MRIIKGPYLQRPETDAVTVMWQTDEEAVGQLRVYPAEVPQVPAMQWRKYGWSIQGEPMVFTGEKTRIHKIRATGLLPGQPYYYEVQAKTEDAIAQSDRYTFSTAPEKTDAFSFVAAAEFGTCWQPNNPAAEPMLELIRREHPDFLLSVGDLVHEDGRDDSEWGEYLFGPFGELLRTTPIYPCVGNHEVGFTAAGLPEEAYRYENFKKYFDLPPYYAFDYGCAHFCVLDCPSMIASVTRTDDDGYVTHLIPDFMECDQIRFLKEDLARTKAKWKFVAFHFPPYTSAWFTVRDLQLLAPIFEAYGVDIVFNSHAVIYERTHPIRNGAVAPEGVRYVVVGGFGAFEKWIRDKTTRFSAKVSARPSYVRVSVTPWRMELQAIDCEGKLFDTLTIDKPES